MNLAKIDEHALTAFLSMAVPLEILRLKDCGGPTAEDIKLAQKIPAKIGARGDMLLYGGKPGEAGKLAGEVAYGIAILAFARGGVELFGQKWEA